MTQADVVQFLSTGRITTNITSLPFYWPLLTLALVVLVTKLLLSAWSRRNLPPGPRGLPLFGNAFQLNKYHWLRFTEWQDQFGPIFSLNLAGQPAIVLNNRKVTSDLLDRRSSIYSDRPRLIMAGEILTGGIFIAFLGYGELWRKLRRAGHEGMNIRAAEKYQPLQEMEAAALISGLIRDPGAWVDHLKRSAASTILSAVYAWPPIESKDDPIVSRILQFVNRATAAALPGAYLVEIFPIMLRLPSWMAKWKREGLEWHRKDSQMFEGFLDGVRQQVRAGEYQPSFAASLIENEKQNTLTPKESAWLAGTMFAAGSETVSASLAYFMLAMNLYPDVMRKGQAEIDAIIGRGRMPTFADRPRLPYIQAMVKELLRWRPTSPVSIPRRTSQDDWYDGYFIPKGTIILSNIWAMNRDPEIFPDFEEFRPERYLDVSGQVDIPAPDTHGQGHVSYGFGRRICIGMFIANQALFINIASILWAVNIGRAVDSHGAEIMPSRTDFLDEGIVVRPVPFKCKITARSTDVSEVLDMAKA